MTQGSSQLTDAPSAEGRHAQQWHAWHLHLASPERALHDRVINDVIGPAIDALPDRDWFFMRYWQAGPHLRLRIANLDQLESETIESALRSRLATVVAGVADQGALDQAGYRLGMAGLAGLGEGGQPLTIEDALDPGVYRRPYQPEFDRYAGVAAMPASERMFRVSSELVLSLLPHLTSTARRSMLAAQASMIAVSLLGSGTEQAAFYTRGIQYWRRSLVELGYSDQQLDQLCELAAGSGARATGQPPAARAPQGPLTGWADGMTSLVELLTTSTGTPAGQVVFSHIHMLHNRLGLRLIDELQTYARLAGRQQPSPVAGTGRAVGQPAPD